MHNFLSPFLLLSLILKSMVFPAASLATGAPDTEPLRSQIEQWLNTRQPVRSDAPLNRQVTLITPAAQLAGLCAQPQLSINAGDRRLTGNKTVTATCGKQRRFIQIKVQASGNWFVSRRQLAAGTVIAMEDIQPQSGSADFLPPGVLFSAAEIVGQTATRVIQPGQPLQQNQLRKPWRISHGQQVDTLVQSQGFSVRSRAKALTNAAVGDMLRLRTHSGKIISGKVTASGQVELVDGE